jgi:hypothetical protein
MQSFEDALKQGDLIDGAGQPAQTVAALTPTDLRAKHSTQRDKAVQVGVQIINAFLEDHAEALDADGWITVYVVNDSALWKTYHPAIVQAFRDAGWVVAPVAAGDVNYPPPAYKFSEV